MKVIDILNDVKKRLTQAAVDNPVLDAEIIVSDLVGIERYCLITEPGKEVSEEKIIEIDNWTSRREKREPLAYIRNKKEFYSLDFFVDSNVLIPRPETEAIVDLAIYHLKENGSLLDLCTGSGAIAISVKHNRKDVSVKASDISEKALDVAKLNCKTILDESAVVFIKSNLYENIHDAFDVIVTNPPYVNPKIKDQLQEELTYEPQLALYAENNGFEIIDKIIKESFNYLTESGFLIIEIGESMGHHIKEIAGKNNLTASILKDYSGMDRIAILKKD